MAPKGKDKTAGGPGAAKGKGKGKDSKDSKADEAGGGSKVKGAQQINVRHILVRPSTIHPYIYVSTLQR